jgi:hypothetical protein
MEELWQKFITMAPVAIAIGVASIAGETLWRRWRDRRK